MAITYGFYNSMNGDRKYDAVQLSSIFDGVIRDGVFQSIGGYLATKPGTGMQVIVAPGKAWFDHTWTVNDADLPLDISPSDLTLSRYDAVVLETDATKAVRENSIKVLKGTPASDPKKPTLTNEGDVHQHPLAYILVPGGSSSIQVQNIDIMVGKSECPFVTSILESVSIETLLEKWEGEFRVWFDELQNQMSGDVATNLQNQITKNAGTVGDIAYSFDSEKPGPWLLANGDTYDVSQKPELFSLLKKTNGERKLSSLWTFPLVRDCMFANGKVLYRYSDITKWYFGSADEPFSDGTELIVDDMLELGRTDGVLGDQGPYYGFYYTNGIYVFAYSTTTYKLAFRYSADGKIWSKSEPMKNYPNMFIRDFGGITYFKEHYVFEAVIKDGNYYRAGLSRSKSIDSDWVFGGIRSTSESYMRKSLCPVVSPDGKYVFSGGKYSSNNEIVIENFETLDGSYKRRMTINQYTETLAILSIKDKMYTFEQLPEDSGSYYEFLIYELNYLSPTWDRDRVPVQISKYGKENPTCHASWCQTEDAIYILDGQKLYKLNGTDITVIDEYPVKTDPVCQQVDSDSLDRVCRNGMGVSLMRVLESENLITVFSGTGILTNNARAVPAIPSEYGYAYIRSD